MAIQLACLFAGTQMPGTWRDGIEGALGLPFGISSWAHFVLFAGMTVVARTAPLALPAPRVLVSATSLALVTEGLQFFAVGRHPRWIDVGIDMSGALVGILLAQWISAVAKNKQPSQ